MCLLVYYEQSLCGLNCQGMLLNFVRLGFPGDCWKDTTVLSCCMEMVVRACPPIWCCMLRPSLIRLSELPSAHSSRLGGRCDHWLWVWYVVSKAWRKEESSQPLRQPFPLLYSHHRHGISGPICKWMPCMPSLIVSSKNCLLFCHLIYHLTYCLPFLSDFIMQN